MYNVQFPLAETSVQYHWLRHLNGVGIHWPKTCIDWDISAVYIGPQLSLVETPDLCTHSPLVLAPAEGLGALQATLPSGSHLLWIIFFTWCSECHDSTINAKQILCPRKWSHILLELQGPMAPLFLLLQRAWGAIQAPYQMGVIYYGKCCQLFFDTMLRMPWFREKWRRFFFNPTIFENVF